MNLVLDIGNTFTKAAIFSNNKLIADFLFKDNKIDLEQIAEKVSTALIKKAIYSSVRNQNSEILAEIKDKFPLLELTQKTKIPIANKYKTPATLGKDRIALAVGANNLYSNQNVLIIDAGTCITYDFINSSNEYLGGAISPGLQIRFKSLHTFTEKLPLIEMKDKVELIGTTTEESILSGVLMGATAEIDKIIETYMQSYSKIIVLITGGDAKYFVKTLKNNIFANSKILLYGLNTILNYNA